MEFKDCPVSIKTIFELVPPTPILLWIIKLFLNVNECKPKFEWEVSELLKFIYYKDSMIIGLKILCHAYLKVQS